MLRDKTTARIVLVLSIANVAVAAPAVVRQRSLDVAKEVTRALEKRVNSDDESSVDLYPVPVPQIHNAPPPKSGIPPPQDDQLPTSGTPPPQDHTSPAPGDPQSHDYPFRWWEHTNWRPTGAIVQGESSSQLEPGGAANNVGSPKVARRFATSAGNPHRCTMIRHRHQEPRGPHRCTSRSVRNIFDLTSSWRWVYNLISVQGAPSSSHSESEGSTPAVTTTNYEVDALKLKVL